ncbi:MAG: response regulator [Chitinophagaceae bacterium]|nr:response regulator [Chitinophagaceae bacterium]
MQTIIGPLHIFLADDDEDDRVLFKEAIESIHPNFQLTTFMSGQDLINFLSHFENPPPDLIFLDINMPCKNGKVCLKEIRSIHKFEQVPIIMFTTSSNEKDIQETFSYGANKYVLKSDFFEDEKAIFKELFAQYEKGSLIHPTREKFLLKKTNNIP